MPVRFVHSRVREVDEHEDCLSPEHALLKLTPVARLLRLEHPQTDILCYLGEFLGVWHSGHLRLTFRAVAVEARASHHAMSADLQRGVE